MIAARGFGGGTPEVTIVLGLAYGDEGKGTVVDHLSRERRAALVVRYNGGAQAAHNVVTSGGRHHTFAQLGSGTLAGAETLLSRFMLVNPFTLEAEARSLSEPLARVMIDARALVTTPWHIAMNRLREMARSGRHGSCGMGIGETTSAWLARPAAALRIGDLASPAIVKEKIATLRSALLSELASFEDLLPDSLVAQRELSILEDEETIGFAAERYERFAKNVRIVGTEALADALGRGRHVIFEGAQGVLLDQDFGFQPHTTWTDITFANAFTLLDEVGFEGKATRLGVLRAYGTRHGAGPFVTEDGGFDRLSEHDHNRWGEWQHGLRSGALDEVALRYALDVVGGIDALAVTNLDRLALLGDRVPVAVAYESSLHERIEALPVSRPFSLEAQERLTHTLFGCRPILERRVCAGTRGALAYAERIALTAGAPLAIASFGPTSDDKLTFGNRTARKPRIEEDSPELP